MSHVTVETFNEVGREPPSLVSKLQTMAERIRVRAYALFERRGTSGSALDDWLQAERDLILTPESELIEKEGKFEIRIAAPGFRASETSVTALPDVVIVFAESRHKHEEEDGNVYLCEFGTKPLYRRLDLPKPIDVETMKAKFDDGILRISARQLPTL
jgi:HSP20 family molecular chaperone IbpA